MGRSRRACAALVACAVAGAAVMSPEVRAEFEIPEVDVEKGGIEAEYRGAGHWGLPQPEDGGEIDALRQSHELEVQYGLADFWAVRITPNVEQPGGESLEFTALGLETQFVLKPRNGGAFGLAMMGGYAPVSLFTDLDQPDEAEFGPVIELAQGPWLLTLNPRLFRELGSKTEQRWFGFEYASQLELNLARRWSIAALMFGEIEDLSAPGAFSDQAHLLGPGVYFYSDDQDEAEGARDDSRWRWSLGVGALFGLTHESTDATLRVVFAVER